MLAENDGRDLINLAGLEEPTKPVHSEVVALATQEGAAAADTSAVQGGVGSSPQDVQVPVLSKAAIAAFVKRGDYGDAPGAQSLTSGPPNMPNIISQPFEPAYGLNLDDGGNVLEDTAAEDVDDKHKSRAKAAEEQRKQQELQKSPYRRTRANAPPRLTFCGTLMGTFITLLLTAVTTLLIGVPPLYMSTSRTRMLYVAVMIPVLTVVVTVMHYYVTEYPMRQVNLFLLKIAQEMEQHTLAMSANVANVSKLEDRAILQLHMSVTHHSLTTPLEVLSRLSRPVGGIAGGNLSVTIGTPNRPTSGSAQRFGNGGNGVAAVRRNSTTSAPNTARDETMSGVSLLPPPQQQQQQRQQSHQEENGDDELSTLPDAAEVIEETAAQVRRQKRWMEHKQQKLNQLHEDAIHPEVHSQQRLLRYFFYVFFQYQSLIMAAWEESVVRMLTQPGASTTEAAAEAVGEAAAAAGWRTPATAGLLRTPAAAPALSPQGSRSATPIARALTPVRPKAHAAFRKSGADAQEGRRAGMRVRVVDHDDLTLKSHHLLSPDSASGSTHKVAAIARDGTPELLGFTPLVSDLVVPGGDTTPPAAAPTADVVEVLATVKANAAGGPPAATSEGSTSVEGIEAVARQMKQLIVPPPPPRADPATIEKLLPVVEEPDETVRVDVSDPSSVNTNSRVLSRRRGTAPPQLGVTPTAPEQPTTPMPLPVSTRPPTITVKRGHRFVGDAPCVFFFVRVHEELRPHPRTFSTSTNAPGGGSPLGRSHPNGVQPIVKTIAFEALVSTKGNHADTLRPPFFTHDRQSGKPYTAFLADDIRGKRGALTMLEQLRLTFGYCEVERDPASDGGSDGSDTSAPLHGRQVSKESNSVANGKPKTDGDSDVKDSATGTATAQSPLNRESTKTAAPSQLPAAAGAGARSVDGGGNVADATSSSNAAAQFGSLSGSLVSSYVLSWKPFPERPMRLTFLSVLLDEATTGAAAAQQGGEGGEAAHGNTDTGGSPQQVWLPVLECLIDDVLCVLTEAHITIDRASQEVVSVELRGISIEDVSRGSSQLLSSSDSVLSLSASKPGTSPLPLRGNDLVMMSTNAYLPSAPEPGARKHGKARLSPAAPRGTTTKTIGQVITELVFVSNVPSSDDDA